MNWDKIQKYLALLTLGFLIGSVFTHVLCYNLGCLKDDRLDAIFGKTHEQKSAPQKEIPTPAIQDTFKMDDGHKQLMGTVKGLLIDYYKAGYMDGQNKTIDLYNAQKLDNRHVEKHKLAAFRKIESDVNERGGTNK